MHERACRFVDCREAGVAWGQPGRNLIIFITDKYSESVRRVVSSRRASSQAAQEGGCKLERRGKRRSLNAAHERGKRRLASSDSSAVWPCLMSRAEREEKVNQTWRCVQTHQTEGHAGEFSQTGDNLQRKSALTF